MVGFSYELRDMNELGMELILMGYMDEQVILPETNKFANAKRLVVNFGQVNAILSMGVKEWLRFSDKLEQLPHLKVVFKNCSKQVIDQINLVKGFLPANATVSSMFIPVYCEACNRQFKVLRKTENIKETIHNVIASMDVPDCSQFPKCKEQFELECNPLSYLNFIKS